MKIGTRYNRVTHRLYTLSTSELTDAVRTYVARRTGSVDPPANAREETEIDFGDSHAECLTLTRRFIYDDELPPSADAVDPHAASTGKLSTRDESDV